MSKYYHQSSSRGPKTTTRTQIWSIFAGIIILTLFFLAVSLDIPKNWPGSSWINKFYPHLGLDLQGGTHLVYEADTSNLTDSEKASAVDGVREVIERRVNAYGVTEPLVQTTHQGSSYRVIVELAGVTNVNDAIKLIGQTPLLEFKEIDPTAIPTDNASSTKAIDTYNAGQKKKAEDTLKKIKAGGDFAALAKELSDDPGSKANGGDLGFVTKGNFVPEFDAVIFDTLKDGQLDQQVVTTPFGYHIIKRVASRNNDKGELEVQASHILFQTKTIDKNNQVNWKSTGLTGKQLKKAQVTFAGQTNEPQVNLIFDADGTKLFADITKANVGKQVAIFLDGQIISAPTVQTEITGGTAVITGNFSLSESKLLAQRLNAGALPVAINLLSQQTIGPTLGKVSLERSLLAGLIGLILVALFMLIYYRVLGLIAVIALCFYTIINYGLFIMIPVTLTTAGIAGFILSIGMAVDANVLIFERTKEELRAGEHLDSAIEKGFSRAWLSIRDSNISSLITTAILFWFGSSIIKGFALTLGLGILVSMFTSIFVSRNLIQLIAPGAWLGDKLALFGVKQPKK
jgi:protein-export membrane protein SecD